jgi:glycosyltransferase involved in cell wall biosynthesis
MPSVEATVVIPTKDRWPVLSTSALPSALGQEAVELEVIVVDDGSTDATGRALEELREPRLRVIRHATPHGVARARNAGIAAARGEWVAFLDDDDIWSPEKLRRQIDAAEARQASFAYSAAAWLDEDRRFLSAFEPPDPDGLPARLLRWNELWAGCSNVIARTEVVRRLGAFDEQLFQLADWDLWIRLACNERASAVDDVLVGYVVHSESMLLTDRRDVFAEFHYLTTKHRELSARIGARPDPAKFWRWVAAGHLRAGRRKTAARTYAHGALVSSEPELLLRALASLSGRTGFTSLRALARKVRGDDAAKLPVHEPPWIASFRDA